VLIDLNPAKDPGTDKRAEAKAAFADSLTRLCEYSISKRKNGPISISLEHFDRDVDKRYLLGPTVETVEVVEQVKKKVPNIGITMDISHLILLGEDPADSVKVAAPHILHAHLSNYILREDDPRSGDRHPPFWVPYGKVGAREVAAFLHALENTGYFEGALDNPLRGIVTFEIRPGDDEPPEMVIAGSKRLLRMASGSY
jgi:sugar phosphate isomerase/epimerase